MKEVQDFLSVVRTEAVFMVYLCACLERIELRLPVRWIQSLVVPSCCWVVRVQELLVISYVRSLMSLRFCASSPSEVERHLNIRISVRARSEEHTSELQSR